MEDNNTYGFNGRIINGGRSGWSMHAYGLAIDINPVQNPYFSNFYGTIEVLPFIINGQSFVNRDEVRPNKKPRPGRAVRIFRQLR